MIEIALTLVLSHFVGEGIGNKKIQEYAVLLPRNRERIAKRCLSAHRPPAAVNGARASALSSFDRSFVAVDGSGHFEADFFPAQAVTIDGVQQDIVRPQGKLGLLFQCDRLGLAIFDDRDDR